MDVVLVGVVARELENHSLGALRGALDAAGKSSVVVPFGGFAGMEVMLRETLRWAPRVCGISIQTTESLLAALTFTRLLRQRGFGGTIVAGGHVATLAADEIIHANAGVDVVVELAGERALVGLAQGDDPSVLPGTRTRAGRGRPAQVVTPGAVKREAFSEHLGIGVADLLLGRGCAASCGYCCVGAASDRAEQLGAPRQFVREVEHIADEIAHVAARGARALHFMDDNVLPLDVGAAISWVVALRGALARRGVPRLAFSLQLRADVVTAPLADALVELGLVRAYVGIDGYSQPQLRALGRSAPSAAGRHAIDTLVGRGVYCIANALVVGPTLRLETIAGEVAGLAAIDGAAVHLLPIEARPGTTYHRRAHKRGLLEGGPLWPVHRFEDPRAFLISQVLTGLPSRLAERSVPIALYDLAWALGVARRLVPTANVAAANATYDRVVAAWNRDQVRLLRVALVAAAQGAPQTAALLAAERDVVRAHDDALLAAADDALIDVERAVSLITRVPVRAQARGRALGGIAFAMGLASAACSPSPRSVTFDASAVDAAEVCADPNRAAEVAFSTDKLCTCDPSTSHKATFTFDAAGVVTSLTTDGAAPLSDEIRACIVQLLAGYCYPSLAGTSTTFPTCHSWIA